LTALPIAARPLGSPGVVSPQLLAAPGSFEDRHGLLVGFVAGMVIVGLCAWAMPASRPALSPYGSSQQAVSPPDGASIAIAGGGQ
jgi:hypothetical protein